MRSCLCVGRSYNYVKDNYFSADRENFISTTPAYFVCIVCGMRVAMSTGQSIMQFLVRDIVRISYLLYACIRAHVADYLEVEHHSSSSVVAVGC